MLGKLGQILFNQQTEVEMQTKFAMMFAEIRALDRSNIRHASADSGRDKTMIAKSTVGRVNPDPSGARKKNIHPGVETALRSPILNINVEFTKETAHHSDGQADLPQHRRAKQRSIPAGARPHFDRLGRQSGFSFVPYFVPDFAVQRIGKLD